MLINNIRKSPTFPIRNTIHAPTRGATTKTGHIPVLGNFQSTLLQEERPEDIIGLVCNMWLSIHAPTRGATRFCVHWKTRSCFQSTLLQEERPYSHSCNCPVCNFQSTLLQEERHGGFFKKLLCFFPFNPRSYKRSDDMQTIVNNFDRLSIHAPTRGATVLFTTIVNIG